MNTRNIKIKIIKTFKSKELRDLKRDNRRIANKIRRLREK